MKRFRRSMTTLVVGGLGLAWISAPLDAAAQQAQTERVFDAGSDSPSNFPFFDWRFGSVKAECGSGGPMVGLSARPLGVPQLAPHSILCRTPHVNNTPLPFYQENPPSPYHENSE